MAEKSLDDFFAKKDKSKKKSKFKSAQLDPETKQSEADLAVPKKEKKKKEKEKSQPSTTSEPSDKQEEVKEDEEWKEVEEEKEVDYTGLRIHNQKISKEEAEKNDEEQEEEEVDEDGEIHVKEKKDTSHGPWKPSGQPPAPAPAPQPVVVETKPKEEVSAPKIGGKYVPPGARSGAAGTPMTSAATPLRKKKNAPNLQSEEDFPTLGGSGGRPDLIDSDYKGGNFEQVQTGGRQMGDPSHIPQQLSLGNKYAALQD